MFDFLDIEKGKFMATYSGLYYETQPEFALDSNTEYVGGIPFNYEIINEKEKRYEMLFGNVSNNNENNTISILAVTSLDYKVGAFVTLEDGTFYSIWSVAQEHEMVQKELAEILSVPSDIVYALRLVQRANPFQRDNI